MNSLQITNQFSNNFQLYKEYRFFQYLYVSSGCGRTHHFQLVCLSVPASSNTLVIQFLMRSIRFTIKREEKYTVFQERKEEKRGYMYIREKPSHSIHRRWQETRLVFESSSSVSTCKEIERRRSSVSRDLVFYSYVHRVHETHDSFIQSKAKSFLCRM